MPELAEDGGAAGAGDSRCVVAHAAFRSDAAIHADAALETHPDMSAGV